MRRVSLTPTPSIAPVPRVPRAAVLLLGLAACERPRDVAVRVSIPGPDSVETPVTGVGVVALPYDRDSVLRQLEARARTPRPATAPLESLFAAFRGPFTDVLRGDASGSASCGTRSRRAKAGLDTAPRNARPTASLCRVRPAHRLAARRRRTRRPGAELDRARREFVRPQRQPAAPHAPVGR